MTKHRITAVIVDDELDARNILEDLLKDYPEIHIIEKLADATKALESIITHQPELIFLDIDMPKKNGIELAKEIRKYQIETTIIFVTAYNQHAINAFEVAAFDYLLKPIVKDKLAKTIERFNARKNTQNLAEKLDILSSCLAPEKLRFANRSGFIMIDPREIVYCEAQGNYTYLILVSGNKELITMQIGKLNDELCKLSFLRINRSILVNKLFITAFNRKTRMLILNSSTTLIEFKVSLEALRELK